MADVPDDLVVLRGERRTIAYVRASNGRVPAQDFFTDVVEKADLRRLRAAFERLAAQGQLRNVERFRKERGEIYAFKSGQIRLGAFRVGSCWFLTHGFVKKQQRWPPKELDRAERIRTEHIEWMKKEGML